MPASDDEASAGFDALMLRLEREGEGLCEIAAAPALRFMWSYRAGSELQAASVFGALLPRLSRRGLPPALLQRVRSGGVEERRHSQLCHRMACLYAGRALPAPTLDAPGPPRVPGADDDTDLDLNVLGMLCVNESLSTAYLSECHAVATAPAARTAIRSLLADEVGHARLGWAYLAWLPRARHEQLQPHLGWLLGRCLASWERSLVQWPAVAAPGHGLLTRASIEHTLQEALTGLVLPGFVRVGLPLVEPT